MQVHGVLIMTLLIFGVDNSSSSHSDNPKNNVLVLGERPTCGINGRFGSPEKSLVLILLKQNKILFEFNIIMLIIVGCLLMEKKSLNFKLTTKVLTFQLDFA